MNFTGRVHYKCYISWMNCLGVYTKKRRKVGRNEEKWEEMKKIGKKETMTKQMNEKEAKNIRNNINER